MYKNKILMVSICSIFCVACSSKTQVNSSVDVASTSLDEAVNTVEAQAAAIEACRADKTCDVASDFSDEQLYGGIQKEYTVKGCKVTIYNNGPVKMVDEKTDKPCDAPIPKDHVFSKKSRSYQENGCTITEYESADGAGDATMDCSKKK